MLSLPGSPAKFTSSSGRLRQECCVYTSTVAHVRTAARDLQTQLSTEARVVLDQTCHGLGCTRFGTSFSQDPAALVCRAEVPGIADMRAMSGWVFFQPNDSDRSWTKFQLSLILWTSCRSDLQLHSDAEVAR